MFSLSLGEYEIDCQDVGLPHLLPQYVEHAGLAEQIDLAERDGAFCFFSIKRRGEPWPFLVVAQRYSPAGGGFFPGALVVPETHRLFIGAGKRLLGYDLQKPARIWEDAT